LTPHLSATVRPLQDPGSVAGMTWKIQISSALCLNDPKIFAGDCKLQIPFVSTCCRLIPKITRSKEKNG
jgi:hypothetical protein